MRIAALALLIPLAAIAGPHDPAPTPALAPEEAVKHFRVPQGFEVRLFAAEPMVANPVAMTWDERGRLWVVELYDYPYTTKEGAKNRDRVKVLEDTNNDGLADKETVFADGLNMATAIAVGNGGVYVGAAPHLYFMKDTNGDDVADEKTIILTGFGLEDRHETLNNLAWGPDGWLYFTHGVFTQSKVIDPKKPDEPPVKFNAAVMRLNTATNKLEQFADGISNQWGVDWDRYGNAFVSACVVEHLWHVVPGGIYVRQGGVPGWQHAYDLLRHINDHKHHRAAYSGIQVYQGGAYPAEYDGTILMGNIHGNCINRDKLVPNGSSFIAQDLHKGTDHKDDAFLNSTDGWFRPVATRIGPDGNVWIIDWYDKYPCYQNARQPDLDRERGRVWRVVYTGDEKGKAVPTRPANLNLAKLSDAELVETLKNKNVWMRRMAQRLLSERKAAVKDVLLKLALDIQQPLDARLGGFWTLHACGHLDGKTLSQFQKDKEESIRMWTARFVADLPSEDSSIVLATILADDPSPVVRAGVAAAFRQMGDRPTVLSGLLLLMEQPGNAKDPMLPQMIWYALEPLLVKGPNHPNPSMILKTIIESPEILSNSGPLLPRSIARRMYSSGDAQMMRTLMWAVETAKDKPIAAVMLDGILAGHKEFMTPPATGQEWVAKLAASSDKAVADRAKRLATLWGNEAGVRAALKTVTNSKASDEDRAAAAKLLKGNRSELVRNALHAILAESGKPAVKLEAIAVLSDAASDETADIVVRNWDRLATPDLKTAAAQMLATKARWAKTLLTGVKDKKIASTDIPLPALRAISEHAGRDVSLKALMAATVGAYRPTPGEKQKLIEDKKAVVMSGAFDKARGKELYTKHCAVCHKLNGEGAEVGPDITGVGRGTLDLLMNNVIDPDQLIGAGYENTIVDTKDGDTKSGRLIEDTDTYIKLLSAGPREDVIQKKDIKEFRTSAKSAMPEGFEQIMKDDEFRDLMRYVLEAPAK